MSFRGLSTLFPGSNILEGSLVFIFLSRVFVCLGVPHTTRDGALTDRFFCSSTTATATVPEARFINYSTSASATSPNVRFIGYSTTATDTSTNVRFIGSSTTVHRRDEALRRGCPSPRHMEPSPAALRTPRPHYQPPILRRWRPISQPAPRRLGCTAIQPNARRRQCTEHAITTTNTSALSRIRSGPKAAKAIQRQDQGGTLD